MDHHRHHPRLVRSWTCGSQSCVRPLVAMADIRAEPAQPITAATAGIHVALALPMAVPAALLRATAADRPATVDRAVHRAMAVAAAPVAAEADTIRRRVVEVDITPVVAAVDTPAVVADTRGVVVAVTPVAADMAAAIAKRLGDAKSLREAAT